MAIVLSSPYIAVNDVQPFGGSDKIKQATVRLIPVGMTGITVGQGVFFHKDSGYIVMYNDKEHMIVKLSDIMGRVI